MSFKLTKQECKARDELLVKLEAKQEALEAAVDEYNTAISELREGVETALAEFNEALDEARSFAGDIANQADNDISEKSERWQEGEKGQAAAEWKDAWQNAADNLQDLEIEFPEELQPEYPDFDGELAGLPEEAEA